MSKHTLQELKQYQALPLNVKVMMTKDRIRGWVREFGEDGVYVSFSGGKDSTVLLHMVREEFPNIPAVFVDVPTQYPELREFAQTFENVEIIKPKMSFMEVCDKYGFPLISKEVSNNVMGARKYIKELDRRKNARQTANRQTDRQTDRQIPYSYNYRRICGIAEYDKRRFGKDKRITTTNGKTVRNVVEAESGDYP